MSATADRPAVTPAADQETRPFARAEGLELLGDVSGSGYKEGAALVRRADGQMVHLGPLMCAVREAIAGRRAPAGVAGAATERLGRRLEPEQVAVIADKLAEQGLLAGSED